MPRLQPIEINVGYQLDGITYQLHPKSKKRISEYLETHPGLRSHPVSSVFISYDTKKVYQQMYASIDPQVVLLLTGLSKEEIKALGGYKVVEPSTGRPVAQSPEI
jgi:hypothetical protein